MAKDDVRRVVGKLLSDDAFVEQFKTSPEAALQGYNLTDEERDALRDLDLTAIRETDVNLARDIDRNAIRVGALYVSRSGDV